MNEIKTNDGVWGYIFLDAQGVLSLEDKARVVKHGIEMFYKDEEEKMLKTDNYEGRLHTKREFDMIGSFGGQRFYADLETEKGKVKLKFLVSDQTQQRGYDLSDRVN